MIEKKEIYEEASELFLQLSDLFRDLMYLEEEETEEDWIETGEEKKEN